MRERGLKNTSGENQTKQNKNLIVCLRERRNGDIIGKDSGLTWNSFGSGGEKTACKWSCITYCGQQQCLVVLMGKYEIHTTNSNDVGHFNESLHSVLPRFNLVFSTRDSDFSLVSSPCCEKCNCARCFRSAALQKLLFRSYSSEANPAHRRPPLCHDGVARLMQQMALF